MESIFAPWRMTYIADADKQKTCIFCEFPKKNEDEKNLILHRGTMCFVICNAFPYNPGHLMVAPYRHTAVYEELSDEELLEMHRLGGVCLKVLKKVMHPQGFNLGINLGKVGGAGFDGHLHLHIVPRWNGDTNFMPVLAETRVIAESLEQTYKRLRDEWPLNDC
ncbi:HIT family protein [Aminobacterium colombiense]|mgnify:FL=1|uniref:Histidine triad (HIT) protein n=1 Tax=Aminobacterium colombiense (strain DSM 12261 / ALA-1) TaxID=572547 RepID=D5EHD0_AMICL|nr:MULTISPECIES: HIT domain-containing protein [Aminobacterium]ADE57962.1 histidine triad (HIT) protein [Aminobacterium colombiense DSM 12261]